MRVRLNTDYRAGYEEREEKAPLRARKGDVLEVGEGEGQITQAMADRLIERGGGTEDTGDEGPARMDRPRGLGARRVEMPQPRGVQRSEGAPKRTLQEVQISEQSLGEELADPKIAKADRRANETVPDQGDVEQAEPVTPPSQPATPPTAEQRREAREEARKEAGQRPRPDNELPEPGRPGQPTQLPAQSPEPKDRPGTSGRR